MGQNFIKTIGTIIPCGGLVELDFRLEASNELRKILVPMYVTREAIDQPIVGYKVIEEVIKGGKISLTKDPMFDCIIR